VTEGRTDVDSAQDFLFFLLKKLWEYIYTTYLLCLHSVYILMNCCCMKFSKYNLKRQTSLNLKSLSKESFACKAVGTTFLPVSLWNLTFSVICYHLQAGRKVYMLSCRHVILHPAERGPQKLPIVPRCIKWHSQFSIQNDHRRMSRRSVLYKSHTSWEISTVQTWVKMKAFPPLGSTA
jgi:hypothetical protein